MTGVQTCALRSEEHTSELQSHDNLVCRLLLEKTTHMNVRTHHLHTLTRTTRHRVPSCSARRRYTAAECLKPSCVVRRQLTSFVFFFYEPRPPPLPPLPPNGPSSI